MKKRRSFVLLLMMAVMLVFSVGSVLAQDVDLDSMDDAQLEELLKSIMQKLDTGEQAEETPEAEPELPEIPTPEPTAEAVRFEIYEIKKLTRSRMPDQLFVPKDDGKEKKDKDHDKNNDDDSHHCTPPATWSCYTDPWTGEWTCHCAAG